MKNWCTVPSPIVLNSNHTPEYTDGLFRWMITIVVDNLKSHIPLVNRAVKEKAQEFSQSPRIVRKACSV